MENNIQNDDVIILPVIDSTLTQVGEFEIKPDWVETDKGNQAVHDAVVAYLALIRSGTASTKTRTEVRGGGAKPWKQKGTGRARAGSRRSPLWRGGGIIFGPKPRDYNKKVNKKVNRLALRRALTERIQANELIIVDSIFLEEPRTRLIIEYLDRINAGLNTLIILPDYTDPNIYLAARNLSKVKISTAKQVNVYQLLLHKKIVITQAAIELLGDRL